MLAAFALCSGCKKDDKTEVSGESSWTLAGTTYKTAITYKTVTSGATPVTLVNFWDAQPTATIKVNAVALSFINPPTTTGTYQLVGAGTATTSKQFELGAATVASSAYAYIGSPLDITVTVTGGKIKVVIPEITLKCTTGSPDAKFTGTFTEM